jgi:hypothetical protein
MPPIPVYEERLNVNYPFIAGIWLWALAVGLVPGIILGGLWWLFALYIALTIGIIVSFFHMKVDLFKDGLFYRKVIEVEKIQSCSPYKIPHPMRTYGGWGIRRGERRNLCPDPGFYK